MPHCKRTELSFRVSAALVTSDQSICNMRPFQAHCGQAHSELPLWLASPGSFSMQYKAFGSLIETTAIAVLEACLGMDYEATGFWGYS